ncbi:MAG TPA: GGDEF domain-containing protein [Jiangellales bacterium]|nr:GGDEF domain-containing protein [Jiangellales bacterium]
MVLLALGASALLIADSAFAYLVGHYGTYFASTWVEFGWFIGFLVVGLAALTARQSGGRGDSRQNTMPWIVLPYLPLAVATFTSVVLTLRYGFTGEFLYYLSLVIVGLVVVRQVVSGRDNVALTRQLEGAVQDLRKREQELQYVALHDRLTDLANRVLFQDRAERAMARQNRDGGLLAVLMIDLDGFKHVNDELGHHAGDVLLRAVAERLRGSVRRTDTLARLGGDEFAVLCEGLRSADEAELTAKRITRALEDEFAVPGGTAKVTGSIGVAFRRPGDSNLDEILRQADSAMYAAKVGGKARYTIAPYQHQVDSD